LSENHFHEDRLWANPTAKQPPENHGEQHDENHQNQHRDDKKVKILRHEMYPENDKSPFKDIEKHKGFTIHFDERQPEQYRQQNPAYNSPDIVIIPFRLFGIYPNPFTTLIDRCNMIPEFLRVIGSWCQIIHSSFFGFRCPV